MKHSTSIAIASPSIAIEQRTSSYRHHAEASDGDNG
jgi:hypothetical protein